MVEAEEHFLIRAEITHGPLAAAGRGYLQCLQVYEESSEQTLADAGLTQRQEMLLLEPKG